MVPMVAPNGPVSDIQNLLGDFMVLAQQALKRTGGGWGSICHSGVLFPSFNRFLGFLVCISKPELLR
ncbi:MAG: hypothetical protein AUI16_02970 [Alphaproteobacteria bacterium 13_2_20CM_2_64_7]|jgi:hypothetical protein|nr:MAG: hypothetical protein AUI16_02970 [Alphaproteobacteria bacterium 13_2_20CM_2_64_7]